MNRRLTIPVLALVVACSACVSETERVTNKEDLLAAAGFSAVPANSPDRQRQMAGLPPEHFLMRTENAKLVYFYADPLVCNCIYFGDQASYGRYRQEVLRLKIANEQQLTADTYADTGWNWGIWGPVWWR